MGPSASLSVSLAVKGAAEHVIEPEAVFVVAVLAKLYHISHETHEF